MAEPETLEAYEQRYQESLRVEGHGFETAVISPCPFCAAPDFMQWGIGAGLLPDDDTPNMYESLEEGAVCKECGRGARGVVIRDDVSVQVEMVQTIGPDPPDYLPHMRRD